MFSVIGNIFSVVVIIDSYRILRQRAENQSENNHTLFSGTVQCVAFN